VFEKHYNWSGINVEPLVEPYNKLILNRPKSVNLNLAIDNIDGETEFIYNTGYTEMISGLKKTYDPRHFERLIDELNQKGGTSIVKIVKTKTMKTILEENCIKHINYLSIDVEGGEKNVLESINFNKVFIDVISFEDNFPDITEQVIKFMEHNNYILIGRFGDIIMIHKDSKFIKNLDCETIMSLTY
jgi:FkbM family methyltransferase